MNHNQYPQTWKKVDDSAWERVKAAFKRDWDQTKHHFGAKNPDTDQGVGDTIKQAAGAAPIPPPGVPAFDEVEPAYRFGYAAKSHYGEQYSTWNPELEARLKQDWKTFSPTRPWDVDAEYIRHGWDHER